MLLSRAPNEDSQVQGKTNLPVCVSANHIIKGGAKHIHNNNCSMLPFCHVCACQDWIIYNDVRPSLPSGGNLGLRSATATAPTRLASAPSCTTTCWCSAPSGRRLSHRADALPDIGLSALDNLCDRNWFKSLVYKVIVSAGVCYV